MIPANSTGPRRNPRGFTLIEVLVALAVVALALGALIRTTGQAADTQYEAERRTLALWVASNRLAELGLALVVGALGVGDDRGLQVSTLHPVAATGVGLELLGR
ncbi:MAG: type II secretion system minor pseudopilin GspI, partial [Wenzhouxiangellaceae bacterium]